MIEAEPTERAHKERQEVKAPPPVVVGGVYLAPPAISAEYSSYGRRSRSRWRGSPVVKKRGTARSASQPSRGSAWGTASTARRSPPSATNSTRSRHGSSTASAFSAAASISSLACFSRRRRKRL